MWLCYNHGMSNIHHRNGWHGIDDEANYGQPNRCTVCWDTAKRTFFTPGRGPRRGVTLARIYTDIHQEAHD